MPGYRPAPMLEPPEPPIRNPGNFWLCNPHTGNILLVESGILGFGIWNTAQGNRNLTNDWNSKSKTYIPLHGANGCNLQRILWLYQWGAESNDH